MKLFSCDGDKKEEENEVEVEDAQRTLAHHPFYLKGLQGAKQKS